MGQEQVWQRERAHMVGMMKIAWQAHQTQILVRIMDSSQCSMRRHVSKEKSR